MRKYVSFIFIEKLGSVLRLEILREQKIVVAGSAQQGGAQKLASRRQKAACYNEAVKYIDKLSIRIIPAVLVGLLFAGAFTKITYSCVPVDGAAGCVSYDKAIMHLGDLVANKQDSLIHFSITFVVTSLIVFAFLSILSMAKKKV